MTSRRTTLGRFAPGSPPVQRLVVLSIIWSLNNFLYLHIYYTFHFQAVHSATGGKLGQVMSGISILVLSTTLSIIYNWKLGLVTMVFLPPLCLGMLLQGWIFCRKFGAEKLKISSFPPGTSRDALELEMHFYISKIISFYFKILTPASSSTTPCSTAPCRRRRLRSPPRWPWRLSTT